MKTILMWLLGFVVLFIIFFILGIIGCLCNGTLGFRNGSLVGIDANGQVEKALPWNEGWFSPTDKPTEEEIKQREAKYHDKKSNNAAQLCFASLGAFILGLLTGKAQFHTLALCLLVGALFSDYKTVVAAFLLWYIILALILGGIIALIKGVFR